MLCSGAKRRHAEGRRRWVAWSRDMDMDMDMNKLCARPGGTSRM